MPALRVSGLRKTFGATVALAGVDLEIRPGSIHALIGMNGSGKSTLIKILSGYHSPDAGTITYGGGTTPDRSAAVAFVHQDLGLVPTMTVLENLRLGRRLATRFGRIDWRREREPARKSLARFGLEATIDTEVQSLTRAEATIVALARALEDCSEGCSALVLDEPTSALPASESDQLMKVMRECADAGIGVLFVSHQLGEVLTVSDEVTVLRNGQVAWTGLTSETTLESLVMAMTGQLIGGERGNPSNDRDAPTGSLSETSAAAASVLSARRLSGQIVRDFGLDVAAGEIVGVVGLLGSGVMELGPLLAGRATPSCGTVELSGALLTERRRQEIGFVPADRQRDGVLAGLTASENVSITHRSRHVRRGRISRPAEDHEVRLWLTELLVDPCEPEADIATFSGGNQQKILMARWLSVHPAALVAEEPTQGVDVLAKAQILDRIAAHARDGLSVVLLTGEPEGILDICDRVAVLRQGSIACEFRPPLDLGEIVAAMH